MKEIKLENVDRDLDTLATAAQRERVLITRAGKPVAVIVGIENKDAEDLQLQQSPEFWHMIEERRRRPTIPLERLKEELQAGNLPLCRYSVVIQWSDEDQTFVASLPEFGGPKVHGATYEEAAIRAEELLDRLIETHESAGQPLPEPAKFGSPLPV
jgi:antitoxin HicB